MQLTISHDWQAETPEAKARWFQSLSMQERAEIFDSFTELILELNPKILERTRAEPVEGRIQVLTKA